MKLKTIVRKFLGRTLISLGVKPPPPKADRRKGPHIGVITAPHAKPAPGELSDLPETDQAEIAQARAWSLTIGAVVTERQFGLIAAWGHCPVQKLQRVEDTPQEMTSLAGDQAWRKRSTVGVTS